MAFNPRRFFRQAHYWLSLAVAAPAMLIIGAGIVLMLKKEIGWIQPPTARGVASAELPAIDYEALVAASRLHPEAGIETWTDIDRIDLRVGRGLAKVRSNTGWEVQVDTQTGDVLHVAYRRSDLIESLHDGSYFSDAVKLYIFLPTGVLLLIMWGTGLYLFLIPRLARRRKRAQKAARRSAT
jgi:uncharacterized iron-regulated membrane protein